MHPDDLTFRDVEDGEAAIVVCPDCGQMEIWSIEERIDHGHCRASGATCPLCDEDEGV